MALTTTILWIVYNPVTGECIYSGTDNLEARAALETHPMRGFIVHPVTAQVVEPAPRRKAAK